MKYQSLLKQILALYLKLSKTYTYTHKHACTLTSGNTNSKGSILKWIDPKRSIVARHSFDMLDDVAGWTWLSLEGVYFPAHTMRVAPLIRPPPSKLFPLAQISTRSKVCKRSLHGNFNKKLFEFNAIRMNKARQRGQILGTHRFTMSVLDWNGVS